MTTDPTEPTDLGALCRQVLAEQLSPTFAALLRDALRRGATKADLLAICVARGACEEELVAVEALIDGELTPEH